MEHGDDESGSEDEKGNDEDYEEDEEDSAASDDAQDIADPGVWTMGNEDSDLQSTDDETSIDTGEPTLFRQPFSIRERRYISKRISKFSPPTWTRKSKKDRWGPVVKVVSFLDL